MTTPHQYATAGALRTALETRLLERSRRDGVDLQRLRRQVAFDRLLARMFGAAATASGAWVLKGGYALEMRFHQARSTKDLDLTVRTGSREGDALGHSTSALRERLQLAAIESQSDFFTFVIGEVMLDLDQANEIDEIFDARVGHPSSWARIGMKLFRPVLFGRECGNRDRGNASEAQPIVAGQRFERFEHLIAGFLSTGRNCPPTGFDQRSRRHSRGEGRTRSRLICQRRRLTGASPSPSSQPNAD